MSATTPAPQPAADTTAADQRAHAAIGYALGVARLLDANGISDELTAAVLGVPEPELGARFMDFYALGFSDLARLARLLRMDVADLLTRAAGAVHPDTVRHQVWCNDHRAHEPGQAGWCARTVPVGALTLTVDGSNPGGPTLTLAGPFNVHDTYDVRLAAHVLRELADGKPYPLTPEGAYGLRVVNVHDPYPLAPELPGGVEPAQRPEGTP